MANNCVTPIRDNGPLRVKKAIKQARILQEHKQAQSKKACSKKAWKELGVSQESLLLQEEENKQAIRNN